VAHAQCYGASKTRIAGAKQQIQTEKAETLWIHCNVGNYGLAFISEDSSMPRWVLLLKKEIDFFVRGLLEYYWSMGYLMIEIIIDLNGGPFNVSWYKLQALTSNLVGQLSKTKYCTFGPVEMMWR
jgi:hypothetical protein